MSEALSIVEAQGSIVSGGGDVDLDKVVDELDSLFAACTFDLAYKAGEFLIQTLYGGDIEYFRACGRRDARYQALLQHPRLRLSSTALWRSLRLYELCQRLPWVHRSERINATHVYAVIGLPQVAQEKLLREVEREGWIAGQLEREAKKFRRVGGRGRPRLSAADTSIRILRTFLDHSFSEMNVDNSYAQSDNTKLERLRELLTAVSERCRELESVIHRLELREEVA